MIQILSATGPLTTPRLAFQAITALVRADAMGLVPAEERIDTLDLAVLRRLIRHVHRAGIARSVTLVANSRSADRGPAIERALEQLNLALEESPAPEFEWSRLTEVLGIELLARLLGISPTSVRRYRAAARITPDDVAGKLHFLALIVGDLSGAYNNMGIRQWFDRKRSQLTGCAPAELLRGAWDLNGAGPAKVRDLARSLTASPAT